MAYLRYRVFYHSTAGVTAEIWSGGFVAAKKHATEAVENGDADRVEVRDDADRVVFRYPKSLEGS